MFWSSCANARGTESVIDLAATAVLACLSLWSLLALGLALSRPLWRPCFLRADPRTASALLLGWMSLTLLCSLAITLVLYMPHMRLVAAHCHTGGCASHMPGSHWWFVPALCLSTFTCFGVTRFLLRQWLPAQRLFRGLRTLGGEREGYTLLPHSTPAAFALGAWRPRVFVTRGLLETCRDADLDIILRHEAAHLRRRDNLRSFATTLLTLPLPPGLRGGLLRDHRLLCELACDLDAAAAHPREDVAATLLRICRLQAAVPVGARGFIGDTQARVLALLAPPAGPVPAALAVGPVLGLLLLAALAVDPLHHLLELFR